MWNQKLQGAVVSALLAPLQEVISCRLWPLRYFTLPHTALTPPHPTGSRGGAPEPKDAQKPSN